MEKLFLILSFLLILSGCSTPTLSPSDTQATLEKGISQTLTAVPTLVPTLTPTAVPTNTPKPMKPLSEFVINNEELNDSIGSRVWNPLTLEDSVVPEVKGIIDFYSGVMPSNLPDELLTLSVMLWRFDSSESCNRFHQDFKDQNSKFLIDEAGDGDTLTYLLNTGDFFEIYACVDDVRAAILLYTASNPDFTEVRGGSIIGVNIVNDAMARQVLNLSLR